MTDFRALRAALAQGPVQGALPKSSRDSLWVLANLNAGNLGEAKSVLAKAPMTGNDAPAAMRDALRLQLLGPQGATQEKISKVLERLLGQGMYGEAISLLLRFGGSPALRGEPMMKLYMTALDKIPPKEVPALRFELLSKVIASRKLEPKRLEAVMSDWLDSAKGRVGLEPQVNQRLFLIVQRVGRREYPQALAGLEVLTSQLSSQLPLNHPFLLDMLTIQASVAIVLGQSPPIEALAAFGTPVQGIRASTKKGLEEMAAAGGDEEALKQAAQRFLDALK